MAGREEIKKITCVPDSEQEAYKIYSALGYKLISSNEIYNKNTYDSTSFLESYSGWKSQTTETVHYISMVWKREPDTLPNYEKLVELERRFDALHLPGEKPKEPFGALAILLGLYCCVIPGIIMLSKNGGRKAAIKEWEDACEKYWQDREALINEIVSAGM